MGTTVEYRSRCGLVYFGIKYAVKYKYELAMSRMISSTEKPSDGPVESDAALEVFLKVAELWDLSTEEQMILLGSPGRSTFFKWKKSGGRLPHDTIERISHILSIFKALEILLPSPPAADSWIGRPNDRLGGVSPLKVMLGGHVADIIRVREFVDVERGG